jgi:protein ImuA
MRGPAHPRAAEDVSVAESSQSGVAIIARLKARIARIAGSPSLKAPAELWNFGLPEIDAHLADGNLGMGAVHEVAPVSWPDMPAAIGFAVSLAVLRQERAGKPVLWLRLGAQAGEMGELYGAGLHQLGLPRSRLLTARVKKPGDLLWALEEALRSGVASLVIADAPPAASDLTISRRLQLAAASGLTPAILLSQKPMTGGTAGATRWQVRAAPSSPPVDDLLAPGNPAWALSLTRCRGGKPGEWSVEWHHATHRFSLVSGLCDRTVAGFDEEGGDGISIPARPALRAARRRA